MTTGNSCNTRIKNKKSIDKNVNKSQCLVYHWHLMIDCRGHLIVVDVSVTCWCSRLPTEKYNILFYPSCKTFQRSAEWLVFSSPGQIVITFRPSSVVRPSTFHILIFSSETTGPIATKLWWNGHWMTSYWNCVRWSRHPTKMAAKLKIEKRGDEILIVHCCFSISQNELKF